MSGSIKERFIDEYVDKLSLIYPELEIKDIKKIVSDEINESYSPRRGSLYNNYADTKEDMNTEQAFEFIERNKAIMSGRGVLYKQHKDAINPGALLLQDLGADRKKQKKLMLEATGNKEFELAKFYDNRQKNIKVIMNSFFGVLLQSSSHFFNPHCGLSIMGKGRSIISQLAYSFERFLANNYKFTSFDEMLVFISNIKKEEYKHKELIDVNVSKKKLVKYLMNRFNEDYIDPDNYQAIIEKIVDGLDQEDRNKVYYKNNLFKFFNNEIVFNLLEEICNYDVSLSIAEMVYPDGIDDEEKNKYDSFFKAIKKLWSYIEEWVFYNYPVYDRMNKIEKHTRQVVLVVDTDSNFIGLGKWIQYLKKAELIDVDNETEKFKMINIMAIFLTNIANAVCRDYSINSGIIEEDEIKKLNMKNEFYYYRLLLTTNKKWYCGNIGIKEGKILKPSAIDIKGVAFKKASFNADIGDKIESIVTEKILKPKYIDLIEVLKSIKELENEIRNNILSGETKLWIPARINSLNSYADISKIAAIKAALNFNRIFPRDEMSFPNQVLMIKLKEITRLEDILYIKRDYPEEFENLKSLLTDNSLGWTVDRIAVPTSMKVCPKWIVPLIDVEAFVRDSLTPLIPIIRSIGIQTVATTKDSEYISTLVF